MAPNVRDDRRALLLGSSESIVLLGA